MTPKLKEHDRKRIKKIQKFLCGYKVEKIFLFILKEIQYMKMRKNYKKNLIFHQNNIKKKS